MGHLALHALADLTHGSGLPFVISPITYAAPSVVSSTAAATSTTRTSPTVPHEREAGE